MLAATAAVIFSFLSLFPAKAIREPSELRSLKESEGRKEEWSGRNVKQQKKEREEGWREGGREGGRRKEEDGRAI